MNTKTGHETQGLYRTGKGTWRLRAKVTLSQKLGVILAIYGILVGSVFLVKSITMYIRHDTTSIISPIVEAAAPVQVKPTATPSPTPTPADPKKAYILTQKHGDILLRIWTNESSRGNSDGLAAYCREKGQTNEFGYDPSERYCFSDFEYSVRRVDAWWETCLQTRSLEACLLRYSGNDPDYVGKFLSQSNH